MQNVHPCIIYDYFLMTLNDLKLELKKCPINNKKFKNIHSKCNVHMTVKLQWFLVSFVKNIQTYRTNKRLTWRLILNQVEPTKCLTKVSMILTKFFKMIFPNKMLTKASVTWVKF